jgi:DNA polymerase-3 subunit epsilon
LAEVYLAMTRGQESLTIDMHNEYEADGENDVRAGLADVLILAPTEAELAEHEALLTSLDKQVKGSCLWRQPVGD